MALHKRRKQRLSRKLCAACQKLRLETWLTQAYPEPLIRRLRHSAHTHCILCMMLFSLLSREHRNGRVRKKRYALVLTQPNNHNAPCKWIDVEIEAEAIGSDPKFLGDILVRLPAYLSAKEAVSLSEHDVMNELHPADETLNLHLVKTRLPPRLEPHSTNLLKTTEGLAKLFGQGFRLIDSVNLCLVQKTCVCQYVALSYVWGKRDESWLYTTTANEAMLSEPYALAKAENTLGKRLPRTIADAMKLVRLLKYRYLWVDSLCICQDEGAQAEKERLIHNMGNIYREAALTIISTHGPHADAPLPGLLTRDTRFCGHIHTIDLSLGAATVALLPESANRIIQSGTWALRGWTLQEEFMSSRCLYLTPSEAIYSTQGYVFRESGKLWQAFIKKGGHATAGKLESFQTEAESYRRREFTYPSDFFHAFAGIYRHFCPHEKSHGSVYDAAGTPLCMLPSLLLWYIQDQRGYTRRSVGGSLVPTWSWAAPTCERLYWFDSINSPVEDWYLKNKNGDVLQGSQRMTLRSGAVIGSLQPRSSSNRRTPLNEVKACLSSLRPGELGFWAPCIPLKCAFFYSETRFRMESYDDELLIEFWNDFEGALPVEAVIVESDSTYLYGLGIRTERNISRRVGLIRVAAAEKASERRFPIEDNQLTLSTRFIRLK